LGSGEHPLGKRAKPIPIRFRMCTGEHKGRANRPILIARWGRRNRGGGIRRRGSAGKGDPGAGGSARREGEAQGPHARARRREGTRRFSGICRGRILSVSAGKAAARISNAARRFCPTPAARRDLSCPWRPLAPLRGALAPLCHSASEKPRNTRAGSPGNQEGPAHPRTGPSRFTSWWLTARRTSARARS